jgi:hypothetical protein
MMVRGQSGAVAVGGWGGVADTSGEVGKGIADDRAQVRP